MKTLIACVMLITVITDPANAGWCAMHGDAVEALEGRFGEKVSGLGVDGDGRAIYELFVANDGSWTFTVTRPSGVSCVLASGSHWIGSTVKRPEAES